MKRSKLQIGMAIMAVLLVAGIGVMINSGEDRMPKETSGMESEATNADGIETGTGAGTETAAQTVIMTEDDTTEKGNQTDTATDTAAIGAAAETKAEDEPTKASDDTSDMILNDGKTAPDFTLMDLEGNAVDLSQLKGEKVYIKFWASWCSICLAGLSEIESLATEEETDFRVLTIVTPGRNGEQETEDFKEWFAGLESNGFTVLLDEEGLTTQAFAVRGYPTSAYIGTDGILVKTLPGHQKNEAIRETFDGIQ